MSLNRLIGRLSTVLSALVIGGCQPAKEGGGPSETVRQTSRNVRQSLDKLQQMGLVDLEDRMALELVWKSYQAATAKGNMPTNWGDLQAAASAAGLDGASLREAQRSGIKISEPHGGQENVTEPPRPRVIAYKPVTRPPGVAVLLADGQIRLVPPNEFDMATGQLMPSAE